MRKWFLQFFNAVPLEERENLLAQYNNLCESVDTHCRTIELQQNEINQLKEKLIFSDGRNQQLLDLLTNKVTSPQEENHSSDEHLQPVATLPMSWPRLRKELEFRSRVPKKEEKSNA